MKKEWLVLSLQVSGGKEYNDDSRVRRHCLIDAKLLVVLLKLFLHHQCKRQLSEEDRQQSSNYSDIDNYAPSQVQ